MSKKTSKVRLQKELKAFSQDRIPYIPRVHVNQNNILEWHFLFEGPPDTPYEGGWYVAKLKFPAEYPFKPPSIFMCTPSGRVGQHRTIAHDYQFKTKWFATGTRLCLSMSDFHPETWNPGWSVATVAKGLLSFMVEDTITTGAVKTTEEEKKALAAASLQWNLTHGNFRGMFPELDGGLDALREPSPPAGGGAAGRAAGGGGEAGGDDARAGGEGKHSNDRAGFVGSDGAADGVSGDGNGGTTSGGGGNGGSATATEDAMGKLGLE